MNLGLPNKTSKQQHLGDNGVFYVACSSRGFYLVMTAAEKPFALGKSLLSPKDNLRREHTHSFPAGNAIDTEK
jgi:hypothetical protein